jgi:putative methionine-R-sulfoxide reductase with GAF domain
MPVGNWVSGFAAKSGRTEIVSDVSKDRRYLQCFANTKSEIAVPITHEGRVVGGLDIDGDLVNAHSSVDREFLEALAQKISKFCI